MPRAGTRLPTIGVVTHTLRVERVRPTFTPLASLARLDFERLARVAKTEIEVGYLSAGHCRQMVRAEVKKGIVTSIQLDPCDHQSAQQPSRELLQLVRKAQRAVLTRARPRAYRPMPIVRFVPQAARFTIDVIVCFRICFLGICITCCSTAAGQVVCGSGVEILPPIVVIF